MGLGMYKADTYKEHKHDGYARTINISNAGGSYIINSPSTTTTPTPDKNDDSVASSGTAETAPMHTIVAPYIHV